MEHLIVSGQGAGDAVAFGRGRVAYLKTLGLPYVSQRYSFDEWDITVKLTPGHEYIVVEGGCSLSMDSGVIDLRTGVIAFPEFGLPGLRLTTVQTSAAEAQMEKPSAGDPNDESIRPLLSGPGIAGRVVWGGARNRGNATLPGDVSRAFMPLVERAAPDAPWTFKTRDENLLAKKLLGMACPPSMFTGLCRDWIQAVMGRFLYTDWHNAKTAIAPLTPYLRDGAPPAITCAFHTDGKTKSSTPPARITASSGLHRDSQGRHWLFLPGDGDTVDVFQLRANACAEQLRAALRPDPPEWAKKLSANDLALLELYILAYSLPVQNTWQALAVPGVKHSADAMGYGWHWARTLPVADRIINDQFNQGTKTGSEYNYAMRSRHERLSMELGEGGRWRASVTLVHGPYDWAVERGNVVILEPYWGTEGGSFKTTPRNTELFPYQDAVFYVWYQRDTLRSASVSLQLVQLIPGQAISTPPNFEDFSVSANGEISGWNRGRTVGARGGKAEIIQKIDAHWRYTVSVAGESITINPGRMERGRWFSISAKTQSAPASIPYPKWDGSTPGWSYGLTYESYFEGYPPYSVYTRMRGENEYIAAWGYLRRISFSYVVDQYAFTVNYPGRVVIGVSKFDSEAVCANGEASRVKTDHPYTRGQLRSNNYAQVRQFAFSFRNGGSYVGSPHIQYVEGLMQDDPGDGPGIPVPEKVTRSVEGAISIVATRAGELPTKANWDLSPSVWAFNEDFTPETFYAVGSAMGKVGITTPRFASPIGLHGDVPDPFIIVGAT